MSAQHTPALNPQIGGRYNWKGQPERLTYVGVKRYVNDRRTWHQFEKVEAPGNVWCEVLDAELIHFEQTGGES